MCQLQAEAPAAAVADGLDPSMPDDAWEKKQKKRKSFPSDGAEVRALRKQRDRYTALKQGYWVRCSAFRSCDAAADGSGLRVFESRAAAMEWEQALPQEMKGHTPNYRASPHCVLSGEQKELWKRYTDAKKGMI